jgi:hypothetical protein
MLEKPRLPDKGQERRFELSFPQDSGQEASCPESWGYFWMDNGSASRIRPEDMML